MSVNGRAGETRSIHRREYLLHTPDTFVRTPMPGITGGVAIVHASPALGAGFVQYTVELEDGGALEATEFVNLQRFCYVLDGRVRVDLPDQPNPLERASFVYFPQGESAAVRSEGPARMMVIEKLYESLAEVAPPRPLVQHEAAIGAVPLGGDSDLLVRSLLPVDFAFDFAVNTMTYAAGASLAQVEIHVMEHGLLMLKGEGTYRLGDDFHHVQAGDFIWMAPYCPQWFTAGASGPAKYLIYKDWNRRPRL